MGQRLFVLIVLFALLIPAAKARATLIRDGDYEMRGKYQGVLFCSDCPGVWTEVTLEDNGPDLGAGQGTFVITERYSGGIHGGETVVTAGKWSAISRDGFMTSGLLQLQSAITGTRPRYFRCVGGRWLSEANPEGAIAGDRLYHGTLMRVIPPRIPTFPPLTEAQAGRTVYGRVGDRFGFFYVYVSNV